MRILLSLFALISLTLISAQGIDLEKSSLEWTGRKILGEHHGEISIQEADFKYKDDQLLSGTIIIDMESMTVTDLEGEKAEKLLNHLKSKDFFETDAYPEAELTFDEVELVEGNSYLIKGEITIKGQTEPIEFYANLKENEALATLRIDRTKFDVQYGSASFFDALGDKAIDDIFEIKARLVKQ